MIDDDHDVERVRHFRFHVRGALARAIPAGLSLAPPDLIQSDVGEWPSVSDPPGREA